MRVLLTILTGLMFLFLSQCGQEHRQVSSSDAKSGTEDQNAPNEDPLAKIPESQLSWDGKSHLGSDTLKFISME